MKYVDRDLLKSAENRASTWTVNVARVDSGDCVSRVERYDTEYVWVDQFNFKYLRFFVAVAGIRASLIHSLRSCLWLWLVLSCTRTCWNCLFSKNRTWFVRESREKYGCNNNNIKNNNSNGEKTAKMREEWTTTKCSANFCYLFVSYSELQIVSCSWNA